MQRLAACLFACSLSSMTNAQSLPGAGHQVQGTGDYVAKMDADRDGRVSLAEYQDWLGYAFHGMDRDRDGVLSAAEQPGGRGKPLGLAEHRARIADRFAKQDANRDGFLSARELAAPPQ